MSCQHVSRRNFLRLGSATAAALAIPPFLTGSRRRALAAGQPGTAARFLFVITGTGGASIIDSFLPVAESEVSSPALAQSLNVYPDSMIQTVPGANLRCVGNLSEVRDTDGFIIDYNMRDFVSRHKEDMLVMTVENTSVNHLIAQKRAITGADIDGGRTIMEAMAMQHGADLPLPSCNMASSGYIEPGARTDVPDYARSEVINNPRLLALSTHSSRGVANAPGPDQLAQAREVRQRLEGMSPFSQRFGRSELRGRYLQLRRKLGPQLEEADLITKLMLLQNAPETPLEELGLQSSPEIERVLAHFPNIATSTVQAQAAVAFLLARYGASCAVTFGPGFAPDFFPDGTAEGTPLAYDFSHTRHVLTQNAMWSQILKTIDGLISLLKEQPHGDGSMWDHSLVYVATDFGRTKERPAGSDPLGNWGSAHDLNNGSLLISPLLAGNRVYGGVDPDTCRTYGFDPRTGEPDPGRLMREGHIYSLIAQAMGVDFPGRHDMSGLLRG